MFADATSFSSKTQFMYFDGGKNKALGEHLFSFPPSPIFIIIFYMKYKKSSSSIERKKRFFFFEKCIYICPPLSRRKFPTFFLLYVSSTECLDKPSTNNSFHLDYHRRQLLTSKSVDNNIKFCLRNKCLILKKCTL